MSLRWKNVLIKLSGEALAGSKEFGFDHETVVAIARQICDCKNLGLNICLTIGGGNIFRGSFAPREIQRITGDYMGMLATVMNGLALKDVLEYMEKPAELYSAIPMPTVAKRYTLNEAIKSNKEGKILIFSGGTGRPYFTTDTSAALTALELNCDLLVKATNVDGVYSANPNEDPSATLYERLTYSEVLDKNLRVMDLTAMTLLKDNNLALMVLNIHKEGNLLKMAQGEIVGTYVSN